jgi:hypothetical protein
VTSSIAPHSLPIPPTHSDVAVTIHDGESNYEAAHIAIFHTVLVANLLEEDSAYCHLFEAKEMVPKNPIRHANTRHNKKANPQEPLVHFQALT